jgi:murein DD-endopeptidase MepM/ murein hydrolase activator NlpD
MYQPLSPEPGRPAPQSLNPTPKFPLEGLLPKTPAAVQSNLRKQREVEQQAWCDARSAAAKSGAASPSPPCVKALNISLFFDGTNNHEPSDAIARPPTTTNVARLYHATVGIESTITSSTNDDNSGEKEETTTKVKSPKEEGYYRYYMQGVGTEFKEIGEYAPESSGLIMATGGENRINWGITRLIDALDQACGGSPLLVKDAYGMVQAMGTSLSKETLTLGLLDGNAKRKAALQERLAVLQAKLAEQRAQGGSAEIKAIRLYVYGFSRGAAEARAFANWLDLLTRVESDGTTHNLFAGLPISIVFLGLFDTVASVGFAYLAPFAAGHMGWADDSMRLPDSTTFLQRCVHLVAAHEQRGSFPLDSIRRKADPSDSKAQSNYRQGTVEYIYPGVHSDVGGGYPPGDQGKARDGGQHLLSQIALHHMYREAFKAGAPLQSPPEVIEQDDLDKRPWLEMNDATSRSFAISESLVNRFNAWQAQHAKGPLEVVMAREAEVITAWRIDRFVRESMARQGFYQHVSGTNNRDMSEEECDAFAHLHKLQLEEDAEALGAPPKTRHYRSDEERVQAEAHAARKKTEAEAIKARYEKKTGKPVTFNTHKDYDPPLENRQLSRAAQDFSLDYHGKWDVPEGETFSPAPMVNALLGGLIYLTNEQDEAGEYERMRTLGGAHYATLFSATNTPANPQAALLIALYDDQVHDSRAWFMNSTIDGREVFSDYFRYRAVFFDDESNKHLSLLARAGQVIGVAIALASIGLTIKRRDPRYLIGLALPSLGIPVLRGKVSMPELPDIQAFDSLTGISLPMQPGMEAVRAFSKDTGSIVALAKALPLPEPLSAATANTPELRSILKAAEAAQALQKAKESKDISSLLGQALAAVDDKGEKPPTGQPSWLDKVSEAVGDEINS